jgi:hypothetical protein
LESVLGNSPISRVLTTARTLADPRKSLVAKLLNTMTGMRVTDVPERTREALVSKTLAALMKEAGAKDFENVYFSKDQLSQMTPEARLKALQLQAFNSMMAKKERERAKQAAVNPSLQSR